MERIVIIGLAGSGKTTLAKKLVSILKINVYHLDRIFWQRDWKRIAEDERIDILQDIVQRKQWIIEGNYPGSLEPCWDVADTIISLDLPFVLCLRRVIKRYYQDFGLRRRDLPMDCTDRLTLQFIIKVLLFKLIKREPIMQKLKSYKAKGKEIIILRSTQEVDDFIAQQQVRVYDEANVHSLVPVG